MRPFAIAASIMLLVATPVRADRALSEPELAAATRSAPPSGGGAAGAPAARRMPPVPPPPADDAELRAALERARPEMQACIDAVMVRGGATVRARISRDAALRLTIRARPRRDAAVEGCIDTAARRHVTPLLGRPLRRALSASIRLGATSVRPPDPPPPRPPAGDAREVHDALDAWSGSLRRCLDAASPGLTGTVTLRVVAHRDGSMVLESASLPPGVPAGPMLVCLQNEVAHVRVSEGGERSVSHDLTLGR